MNCTEANNISIIGYLASQGISPTEVQKNHVWYCSPFRNETRPSFKVNRNLYREMEAAIQITEYLRATALKVYNQIYCGQKYGKYSKEDISVWVAKNTDLPKTIIAKDVLKSSRSQLDRLLTKKSIKV